MYHPIDFDEEKTISNALVFWRRGVYAFVDRLIDQDIEVFDKMGTMPMPEMFLTDRKAPRISAAMILFSLEEKMVLSLIQGTFPKDYLFNLENNAKLPPLTRTPALYVDALGKDRRPVIYGHWHVNDVTGEPPSANEYAEWIPIMRRYVQGVLPSYEKVAANRKANVEPEKLWDDVSPDDEICDIWNVEHMDIIKLIDREVGDRDKRDELPGGDDDSWNSTHWHRGRRRWIGGIRQIESLNAALAHLEKRISGIPRGCRDTPFSSALADIGYTDEPDKLLPRIAKHESTNPLMALVC